MSFFGLNESKQKNIVENSISNRVQNSSSNISRNTIVSSQDTRSSLEVDLQGANMEGCNFRGESIASSTMNQDVQVLSETHTSYDTTLTNNVTNTLKNEVKQKTPGLFQAGLFSSQVNNQLNQAVNSTKNDISNTFYKNRKNLVSSDQSTSAEAKFDLSKSTIKCNPGDTLEFTADASSFLQNNFLSQSLDEESAKSSISTTFSNNLTNVASQTGGSMLGGVMIILAFIVLSIFSKAKDKEGDSSVMSALKKKVIVFLFTIIYIIIITYILTDKHSYKKDEESPECDNGYELSDSFENDQDRKDKCAEKIDKLNNWKELRKQDNFSSTDVSVTINSSSEDQYPRVEGSISHRGIIRERGSDGTFFDVDYTRLNIDPYSDYDCRELGDIPGICRSIEEDFKWEELINQSCGCCNCDPDKIGYMDEWLKHNQGKECALDNSRPIGVFCDKNIDIIQPGAGYETGQNYSTKCRNPKNDSSLGAGDGKCKKLNPDGTTSDIDDDDVSSNIKVSLISETDCVGLSSDLMKDPIHCDHDGDANDDKKSNTEYVNMGCCYKEAPSDGVWATISDSLFGEIEHTGELCDSGTPITPATAAAGGCAAGFVMGPAGCVAGAAVSASVVELTGGICPENCKKADSCRIDYLKALEAESERANSLTKNGTPTDMDSQASHCVDGCEYKIMGVQELRVTEVPDNHIEDPDNIYTIKNENINQEMKPVVYNKDNGLRNPSIDSIWQASSMIHFTNKQGEYPAPGFDKPDDCSGISDNINFDRAELITPPSNNLCECKFRRLPSCIKNKDNDSYSPTMGCADRPPGINLDSDCMACEKKDGSGVKKNVTYGDKLKYKTWGILGNVTLIYLFICVFLYMF